MSIKAYILINAEKGQAGCVAAELSDKPGVLSADTVLGPHDVVALIEANDFNELMKTLRTVLLPVEGIIGTDTMLITSGHL